MGSGMKEGIAAAEEEWYVCLWPLVHVLTVACQ